MTPAVTLLAIHFAAAPLNPAILRDRALLTALYWIGVAVQLDAATEREEEREWTR